MQTKLSHHKGQHKVGYMKMGFCNKIQTYGKNVLEINKKAQREHDTTNIIKTKCK